MTSKLDKQQLLAGFKKIIDDYQAKIDQASKWPWFLDGGPGKPGKERHMRAKALYNEMNQIDVTTETVLYKLCKFFKHEAQATAFRSRVIDQLSFLLDRANNMVYQPRIATNATAAMHDVFAHDKRRAAAINKVIDAYEQPQELQFRGGQL